MEKLPHIEWKEYPNSAKITKPNGDVVYIKIGDFIHIKSKNEFLKIDEFYGNPDEIGPVYFSYRDIDMDKKSFIEIPFSLKTGVKNFMICYPSGFKKYGFHLNNEDWSSIVVCDSNPMITN